MRDLLWSNWCIYEYLDIYIYIYVIIYVNIYQLHRHLGKYVHFCSMLFLEGTDVSWSMVILVMYASKVAPSMSREPRVLWVGMQGIRTIGLAAKGNAEGINFLGYPPKKLWRQRFCWFFFVKLVASFIFHVFLWALEELRHFDCFFPETWNVEKLRLPPNVPAKSSMLGLLRPFGVGKWEDVKHRNLKAKYRLR